MKDILKSTHARALLGLTPECEETEAATAVLSILNGCASDAVNARAAALIEVKGSILPAGFRELLEYERICPTGMLALSSSMHRGGVSVIRGKGKTLTYIAWMDVNQNEMTGIRLGDSDESVTWNDQDISIPMLPETVATALAGRPLADLMRHPVLDTMNLTIVSLTERWEGGSMEVITSLHQEWTLRDEAVHARVVAALDRLVAKTDNVEGISVTPICGHDVACIMTGYYGKIGVNTDMVANLSDAEIEDILRTQIVPWRVYRDDPATNKDPAIKIAKAA